MSRKKKFDLDATASCGNKDYFGTMYDGMCKHEAYKSLPIGARQFYVLCRVEAMSQGKACLFKHAQQSGREYGRDCFVFPATHLEAYGVSRGNAHKLFKQLVDAGFIKVIEDNSKRRDVNVYEFVTDWKKVPP